MSEATTRTGVVNAVEVIIDIEHMPSPQNLALVLEAIEHIGFLLFVREAGGSWQPVQIRIRRIALASPLDIVLVVAPGVVAVGAAIRGLLVFFERIRDWEANGRIQRARASQAEAEAAEAWRHANNAKSKIRQFEEVVRAADRAAETAVSPEERDSAAKRATVFRAEIAEIDLDGLEERMRATLPEAANTAVAELDAFFRDVRHVLTEAVGNAVRIIEGPRIAAESVAALDDAIPFDLTALRRLFGRVVEVRALSED